MVTFLSLGAPATLTNSMIRFFESRLALSFRTRLSHRAIDAYMTDDTYYTVGNLDNRLSNPDQCLTEDIEKFCTQLAYLHSHLTKPIIDIIYFSYLLGNSIGWRSLFGSYVLVASSGWVVRLVTPPFGTMIAQKAELEGEYRFLHSRLIANAEEVAFYRGHEAETGLIRAAYRAVEAKLKQLYAARITPGTLEGFIMKVRGLIL